MEESETILFAIQPAERRLVKFGPRDDYAFHNYAPIKIAYRFAERLSPANLLRSLHAILDRYPSLGGRIIDIKDGRHFESGMTKMQLRVVRVSAAGLRNPAEWAYLTEVYPLRPEGRAGLSLFQPMLLCTGEDSDGSVLLCVFDHVLGDVATYGFFMSAWSDAFRHASDAPWNPVILLDSKLKSDKIRTP